MKPRFLIVEDERDIAELMMVLIEGEVGSGSVVIALTEEEGRCQFQEHRSTLTHLFVDRLLKGRHSLKFVQDVRDSGFTGRIIAMTAGSQKDLDEMKTKGCDHAFRKPFDFDALCAVVRQAGPPSGQVSP